MSTSKKRKLNSLRDEEATSSKKLVAIPSVPTLKEVLDTPVEQHSVESSTGDGVTDTAIPRSFKDLGLIDSLCEACEQLGYTAPRPIQTESIPVALQGRDIIGEELLRRAATRSKANIV